ncbi:tetratricopeptide repeat-containing diguanylate cyclase [Vibrio vulnificus]|uniref:tetratricopeptide repeat-containing diguanylate cyclase n=1 Tax=Vibrio vulnificus TaxID=672 RepID=UPI0002ED89ED|nr:GGDEF domain-containing protein [Vibrio vulnificus]ASM98823.1 diguanylate cyclase [Vibrio vulnificus NBRC 15645 = ATCC 27562]MCL7017021.1 diguanylate cyclase [Vibrio vulnificus]MDK2698832.1 diguanylate cyclase [Vibrio vulnificus]QET74099.1 diguanylate cyclase [Vibrio vulnificus]HAS6136446.1 diguanylate cyclase [Vibrio vulnificus]
MHKKLAFSLLILLLLALSIVTWDVFVDQDTASYPQTRSVKTLASPEEQLKTFSAHHPLLAIMPLVQIEPDKAQALLAEWEKGTKWETQHHNARAGLEHIYTLLIKREIAKTQQSQERIDHLTGQLEQFASQRKIAWLSAQLIIEKAGRELKQGQFDEGLKHVELGMAMANENGADFLLLEGFNTLGILYNATNQLKRSQLAFYQGLELSERFPNNAFIGRYLNNLGLLYVHLEQWDKALDFLQRAETFYESIGVTQPNRQLVILLNQSFVYQQLKQKERAKAAYHRALRYFGENTSTYYRILKLKSEARLYLLDEDFKRAIDVAVACIKLDANNTYPLQNGICTYIQAEGYLAGKQLDAAQSAVDSAIATFEHLQHARWTIRAHLLRANILEAKGQYAEALSLYKKYYAQEKQQIIGEVHALQTSFEVQEVAKERDLYEAQNQLRELERSLNEQRQRILMIWIVIVGLLLLLGVRRMAIIRKHNLHLQTLSYVDPLTGANNRRFFQSEIETPNLLNRAHLYRIVLVDLDWFKSINDTHGHEIGDFVLVETAKRIKQQLASDELFVRWGGEEFLLVLKNDDDLPLRLQKLVESIRTSAYQLKGKNYNITISVGASEPCGLNELKNSSDAFVTADMCLYQAKSLGRDRAITPEQIK